MSIKDLFNPECKTDVLGAGGQRSSVLIDQKIGRVNMYYAASVEIKNTHIDFPGYIKKQIESYQMGITQKGDVYLLVSFKSQQKNPYIQPFRKALAEEIQNRIGAEIYAPEENEHQQVWPVSGIPALNDLLEHLARPGTQNRILTQANKAHTDSAPHRAPGT